MLVLEGRRNCVQRRRDCDSSLPEKHQLISSELTPRDGPNQRTRRCLSVQTLDPVGSAPLGGLRHFIPCDGGLAISSPCWFLCLCNGAAPEICRVVVKVRGDGECYMFKTTIGSCEPSKYFPFLLITVAETFLTSVFHSLKKPKGERKWLLKAKQPLTERGSFLSPLVPSSQHSAWGPFGSPS